MQKSKWFFCGLMVAAGYLIAACMEFRLALLIHVVLLTLCLMIPKQYAKKVFFFLLISLAASCYYCMYDAAHYSSLKSAAMRADRLAVSGSIDSPVKRDGDVVRFFLVLDHAGEKQSGMSTIDPKERIAVGIRLSEEKEIKQIERWKHHDQLGVFLTLTLPEPARNPNAFDYAHYLRLQGITVTGEGSFGDVFGHQHVQSVSGWFQDRQSQAAKRVEMAFSDPVASGYLQSLLFGVQEAADPKLVQLYSDLGLIHILAISGLHVSLVSMFCMQLLKGCRFKEKHAFLITSLLIGGYVLLVGASPSAVRAGLMGALYLWGRLLDKRWSGLDLFGVALLAMLLVSPYQMWQIGFQLSFLVTWGLFIYVPIFMSLPYPRKEWLRSMLAVTTAAQLVSFPIIIYWFHQSSPLSWLVNLLLVPVLSFVVLPVGYVVILLGLIHPAFVFLPATFIQALLSYLHAALAAVGEWHVPLAYWPHPFWWWLLAYAAFLIVVPVFWKNGYHRKRDKIGYCVLLVLMLIVAKKPFAGTDEVRITFLDVGQGDSAVVEIGSRLVYVIDGGGTPVFAKEQWRKRRDPFEVGKNTLLPFLRSRGIERIDRLVLTHGDFDHIGGFSSVVPHFAVASVLVNGKRPVRTEAQLLDYLKTRKVPIVTGQIGQSWSDWPQVRWTWLNPNQNRAAEDNDASIVLLLEAYGKRILFTGDMGKQVEERLEKEGLLPPIDVLKVAHHGSKTGTTDHFLEKIRPNLAIISVGRNNRYGHPAPEVLKRLHTLGIQTIRTDQSGAVTVVINQEELNWNTQLIDSSNKQK